MTEAEKDFQDWAFAHRDDAKREGWTIQFVANARGPGWWRLVTVGGKFTTAFAAWESLLDSCHKSAAGWAALEFLAKHSPRLFIERACLRADLCDTFSSLNALLVTAHLRL